MQDDLPDKPPIPDMPDEMDEDDIDDNLIADDENDIVSDDEFQSSEEADRDDTIDNKENP